MSQMNWDWEAWFGADGDEKEHFIGCNVLKFRKRHM